MSSPRAWRSVLVAMILGVSPIPGTGTSGSTSGTITLEFAPEVQNIQFLHGPLLPRPKEGPGVCADLKGDLRYGQIPFRLPEEDATSSAHFLPFVVSYGVKPLPVLLLDLDQDGAISCDETVSLVPYPGDPGRAFRTFTLGGNDARARSRYRLTLPTATGSSEGDQFTVDLVDVPVARWPRDGGTSLWILFDGNHNGVFDHKFGDGILVDVSGSGRLSTDPYGGDFFSFNLPIRLPWGTYKVLEVDPRGRRVTLSRMSEADAAQYASLRPGDASNPIECKDVEGRPVRIGGPTGRHQILHFWLSGCGSCEREVKALKPELEKIGSDRLAAVGISLDVTENAYREFITAQRLTWPQCFVGAMFWDNPIAVRFGVVGPSDVILLDPDGKIVKAAHGLDELLPTLEALFPTAPVKGVAPPG